MMHNPHLPRFGLLSLLLCSACSASPSSSKPASGASELESSFVDYHAHTLPEGKPLFDFRGPAGMRGGPLRGDDSYVGRYETSDCVLGYDTGGYRNTATEYAAFAQFQRERVEVGGFPATLVTAHDSDQAKPFLAGLDSEAPLKLTWFAECRSSESRDEMVAVMRSAVFR